VNSGKGHRLMLCFYRVLERYSSDNSLN
jgi:hypothetical protein